MLQIQKNISYRPLGYFFLGRSALHCRDYTSWGNFGKRTVLQKPLEIIDNLRRIIFGIRFDNKYSGISWAEDSYSCCPRQKQRLDDYRREAL